MITYLIGCTFGFYFGGFFVEAMRAFTIKPTLLEVFKAAALWPVTHFNLICLFFKNRTP